MTSKTGTNFYMKNKWLVDPRIRKILEGSFFYPLIDMIPYVQKTTFQSFIQSCYDKDSRTFTFGRDRKVELYFGLEDVFALSGFPVDGRPIVCDDKDTKKLCEDMLGTYEEECAMTVKVSQKWLKKKFEVVPDNISEHDIAHYVRGYLIYLIGSKVLPNCDNTTYYPVYWLQFLEDLSPSKLNDVAWGAAAHAMLHTCLRSRTRKNVKGPMWILELFFMERFPKIADLYMGMKTIGSTELKVKTVPLFNYWCPLMVHPGKDTGKPQPEEFVFIRDQMTSKDVNWIPYLDYPRYIRQKIFFSRVVLFNFDQIIYHEPEKGIHQLEIVNLQPVERLEALVVKSSKGCQQRKLMDSYRPYIQMWENRHLDRSCIKDSRPTFSLPSGPAKNDFVEPQTDQHHDDDDDDISNDDDTNDYKDSFKNDSVGPPVLTPVNDFMPSGIDTLVLTPVNEFMPCDMKRSGVGEKCARDTGDQNEAFEFIPGLELSQHSPERHKQSEIRAEERQKQAEVRAEERQKQAEIRAEEREKRAEERQKQAEIRAEEREKRAEEREKRAEEREKRAEEREKRAKIWAEEIERQAGEREKHAEIRAEEREKQAEIRAQEREKLAKEIVKRAEEIERRAGEREKLAEMQAQEREKQAEIRAHAIIWAIERQRYFYEKEQEQLRMAWNQFSGVGEFQFPQIPHTSFHPQEGSQYYDPTQSNEIPKAFQSIYQDIYGPRH